MSRKNKIIVSVVGITIVLLALLGITYAYYLTRIQGNTNTNSISITTANLLLKYDDGSGAIVEENIMPGVTYTKTFSVTNEGNAKIDNYVVYLEEVVNDLTRTEDLTYKLTCSSTAADCAGGSGEYPKLAGIIATNSIEVGVTHNYTLTITYENLPNTDQSIDMGSRISGYIQIYNLTDIVDLTGSVTNASDGDYVQINSVQKISQIVDGKYTLGAIEPGNHTITVRYIDENDEEQIRSTKTITIQKGETAGVSGNVITVTNDSQTVTVNIDATNADNTTISNTIKEYNPFNEGTLAYNIFKNSKDNKNGTIYSPNPITTPSRGYGNIVYTSYSETGNFTNTSPNIYKWYIYGTSVSLDNDGYFKIKNPKVGEYRKIATSMIGNYIGTTAGYWSEAEAQKAINKEYSSIYKVGDMTTSSILYYKSLTKNAENIESTLSLTSDDYGTSYYYRGGVIDNYINFAGMCWKIVRIEGDGSVKLILEDRFFECNNVSYNGNWSDGKSYLFGHDLNNKSDFLNCSDDDALVNSFKIFQSEKMGPYLNKLKIEDWCYDQDYGADERILVDKRPSLVCAGTKLTKFNDNTDMYVSTLTADEIVFAGAGSTLGNYKHFLINTQTRNYWWSLSPRYFNQELNYDVIFIFSSDGSITHSTLNNKYSSRPAIVLKSNIILKSGDGTLTNPYIVE